MARANKIQVLSELEQRTDLVPCAIPDVYFDNENEVNQGSNTTERTYVFMNNVIRIRQTGRIAGLQIKTGNSYLANNGDVTVIELVVFRRDTVDGFFDLVDRYDFTTQFQSLGVDSTVFTMVFPDGEGPFAKKDDYYGIRIVSSGSATSIFKSAVSGSYANNSMNLFDGVLGTTDVDIDGTWSDVDDIPKIRALMRAPYAVCLGDSLTQGEQNVSQDNGPWEEERSVIISPTTYPDKLEGKLGKPIQNSGLGSVSTVRNVLNDIKDRVLNMKPRVCVVFVGSNDVAQGTDSQKFKDDYEQLVTILLKNDIVPVLCRITPRDDLTDSENVIREDLNVFIKNEGEKKSLLVIDLEHVVGAIQEDKTQAFNYWDMNASYNSGDDIHFNETGYEVIAQFLHDKFISTSVSAPLLDS